MHFVKTDENFVKVIYDAKRCKKCILPSTFPDIDFDSHGVCNYCAEQEGDFNSIKNQDYVLKKIRNTPDRQYDCLVLYSGGKDSSYSLYHIKENLKLNPLAFTLDNSFSSSQVFLNMKAITMALDVDHMIVSPSKGSMKTFYASSLNRPIQNSSDIKYATMSCGKCISFILALGARECIYRKIPFLMGGWSPGQLTERSLLKGDFLKSVCNQHLAPEENKPESITGSLKKFLDASDFPELYNPLYAHKYNEDEILKTLEKLGWKRPTDMDSCSSNCQLNGFLIVDHIIKYGFHPYEFELAFHVRHNIEDRDKAIKKIEHISVSHAVLDRIAKELELSPLEI